MKNTVKFIAAALIFALALSVFIAPVFAGEAETVESTVEATAESVAAPAEATEAIKEFTVPDAPEGLNEEGQSLWKKFWNAVISLINGTNARDAVVTVCSILGAVIMIFARSLVQKLANKVTGFTAANGAKVNELVAGFNENSEKIVELEQKLEERFSEVYDKCVIAAEKTSEKDARVEVTNDAVLALAGMLNTIYTSSSTIPDAAKEIIREKYAGVLHAVNKVNETDERLTETSDIVKAE